MGARNRTWVEENWGEVILVPSLEDQSSSATSGSVPGFVAVPLRSDRDL